MKARLMASIGLFLFSACPGGLGQQSWHFEFQNGLPSSLVWSTQPGQTYSLRESANLVDWTNAPGFPKKATGEFMAYAFAPVARGYFQISGEQGGGGWQMMQAPGLPLGQSFDFSAISALDALQLWVSGSVRPSGDACVLHSTNGGTGWTLLHRSATNGFFGELQMTTPYVGYAAGSGVRRTTDGGLNWLIEQGNLPDPPGVWHNVGPEGWVYGLSVVDANRVWTAGYDGASAGVIYHRDPERAQPNPVNMNTPWWLDWAQERTGMYGISAVNATTAWAVGFNGNIWLTTDGRNWGHQTSPTTLSLQDVCAVNAQTAWAVGDGGTILKTSDAGATWTPQVSGTTEGLRRISAINPSVAWAVGGGGVILHTSNGGTNWTPQFSGTTASLYAVIAVDTNTAWVAGEANTLLRTGDGGRGNWPAPEITGVSPALVGSQSYPQKTVTITGRHLRGGHLAVRFGNALAESVAWIDENTVQVVAPWLTEGTYDLTLINEDGKEATLKRGVTFIPYPILTRYTPWHGPAAGGYQIEVFGFNLQSVTTAAFHGSGRDPEDLPVSVVDSTRVFVTVSNSATRLAGPVTLALGTVQNQSAYVSDFLLDPEGGPVLALSAITPANGTALTTVSVTGVGFSPGATLGLCGQDLLITSRSSTQIVGKVAGTDWGVGRLQLVNSETEYISVDPAFLLLAGQSPTITHVAPGTGSIAGGTTVTITGTGFSSTDQVTFDGCPVDVLSRTATSLTALTPPHQAGVVSVFVVSGDLERGAAVLPAAFMYTE